MFQQSLAFFATLLNKDFTAYCNRRLGEAGLMQGQLYFILYVGKHPGCAPKDLVQALRMDIGHTTRPLVKLEQGGFLVQEQNPEDRRAHILRLTEKGEAAFALSHELFAQWDQEVLEGFTTEEKEQLLTLLKKTLRMNRKEGVPCVRNDIQPR